MKKLSFLPVVAITLATGLFLTASTAQAAAIVGDDVKCETFAAIYNIGEDGKRHPYPNEKIYFSHHADFEQVKTISCSTLADLKLGPNVQYDAGKRLIKAPSVPIVYAVGPEGILHPIKDETQAIKIYGPDWAKRVDDMSEVFLSQYTLGDTHPDEQLVEGSVLVGEDGKLLRTNASGFAIEIEDLLNEEEKEHVRKYALEVKGVEERFERTITKISVASRTDEQTSEYRLKYKVIHVVDGEKVEIEIEIEEATEAEKELDRSKIEVKVEVDVEDPHSEESDDNESGDHNGDEEKADVTDNGHIDDATHEEQSDTVDSKDDTTSDDTADSKDQDSDPADSDKAESEDKSAVTTASDIELNFTQPAGLAVAYPLDTGVQFGQFTLGAPSGDVTIDDMMITLLAQDALSSGPYSVGADANAVTQSHIENCRLVNSATGATIMGPLSGSQIGVDQMLFIDDFYLASGAKISLNLTCDMTEVEPNNGSDMLAMYIMFNTDVNAEDYATNTPVGVLQMSTNSMTPIYAVELLPSVSIEPTVSLSAFSPSGAAIPGMSEVFRFNVTAPSSGDIELMQIPLSVITTDNGATDWNHCGNANGTAAFANASRFEIYDDSFTPITTGWTFNRAGGLNCISQVQFVAEDLTDAIATVTSTVHAGSTEMYMVFVDTTDASAKLDDAIRIDMDDEASFFWNDGTTNHNGVGINYLPITGGTQTF